MVLVVLPLTPSLSQAEVLYPQLLDRSIVFNPPAVFNALFSVFSKLMSKRAVEKMAVCQVVPAQVQRTAAAAAPAASPAAAPAAAPAPAAARTGACAPADPRVIYLSRAPI